MREWEELDLFRGIAAVLMVANHALPPWLNPDPNWSAAVRVTFHIGSMAPVLFFFATGFGSGLAARGPATPGHRYGFANKIVILACADLFLTSRETFAPGIDFLGFIAISTLLLEPLRRMERPLRVAVAAVAAVLAVRYGAGSAAAVALLPGGVGSAVALLAGRTPIPHVSYPLFPWIAYPFVGFAVGYLLAPRAALLQRGLRHGAMLVGASVPALIASYVSMHLGVGLNRYGTMSLSYFSQSLAVICLGAALALLAARAPKAFRQFARLRGISSLAVVPIHFVAILLLRWWMPPNHAIDSLLPAIALTCVLSFAGAHAIDALAAHARTSAHPAALWWSLVVGALLCASPIVFARPSPLPNLLASVTGQLVLCVLLVVRAPHTAPHTAG